MSDEKKACPLSTTIGQKKKEKKSHNQNKLTAENGEQREMFCLVSLLEGSTKFVGTTGNRSLTNYHTTNTTKSCVASDLISVGI